MTKRHASIKCALVVLALSCVFPFIFIFVSSRLIVDAQHYLPLPPFSQDNPANYKLPFEVISFPSYSFTGNNASQQLGGWWIPKKTSSDLDVTIVGVHGAGGDRRAFLRQAKSWHDNGYSVLLFDCQTSYRADYTEEDFNRLNPPRVMKAFKFGVLESDDVLAAVRYARKRSSPNSHVIVVGLSNGAASVIVAASSPEGSGQGDVTDMRIDGVVAEAPFASPKSIIEHHLHKVFRGGRSGSYAGLGKYGRMVAEYILPNLIPDWLLTYTIEAALWRMGCLPERHFGSEVVSKIAPRPLLLIHGTADHLVPSSHSEILYQAAKEPKELWLIKDGAHRSGYDMAGSYAYHSKFNTFVRKVQIANADKRS